MNIGQVSKTLGVSQSSIRYYEDLGLIRPQRSEAGYRIFSKEAVRLLEIIFQAKSLGFSLKEIQHLSLAIQSGKMTKQKVRENLLEKHQELELRIKAIRKFQKNMQFLLNAECPNAILK